MIFDTHMHCRYSIDSKMNIDEAKAAAEKLGIGMIITEHWDEDYPTNPEAFVFERPPMTTRSAKNTRLILFWVPCIA